MLQIKPTVVIVAAALVFSAGMLLSAFAAAAAPGEDSALPRSLESYGDKPGDSIGAILANRIRREPFNLVASLIFLCAIVHTFLTGRFMATAHKWEHRHEEKVKRGEADRYSVHHGAELFHFLGEVEAVFGIWAIALFIAVLFFYDWTAVVTYLSHRVNFTEPLFVVVIMTLASTRPILQLAEAIMSKVADLAGGSLTAWWLTILTLGPVLGSFITEPAAMTISALLLAAKFYSLQPSTRFKYATLGLLFVNISVGGTLTHFAAPPVLMVAAPWQWDTAFMLSNFGWKAILGILVSNGAYLLLFRKELGRLEQKFAQVSLEDELQKQFIRHSELESEFLQIARSLNEQLQVQESIDRQIQRMAGRIRRQLQDRYLSKMLKKGIDRSLVEKAFAERFEEVRLRVIRRGLPALLPEEQRPPFTDPDWDKRDEPVPWWVTGFHVIFMGWTILNAHHPALFIAGLLFFLGFAEVTSPYQNRIDLKPPLLVGFFLAGLVVHGGLQGWWIEPVLGNLSRIPLMISATVLTAFNDNAAITFLSTLVPGFTDSLKYAVVAGAVAGGGLTIIANAPNPAGQSILRKFFADEVSPAGILFSALAPTVIVWLCFVVFP